MLDAAIISAQSGAAPRPLGASGEILAGLRATVASRTDISELLCVALWLLSKDPRRADTLRAEDAIETAAKALRLQPDIYRTQITSLYAIDNLIDGSEDGVLRGMNVGVPKLAVRALRAALRTRGT